MTVTLARLAALGLATTDGDQQGVARGCARASAPDRAQADLFS